jgi:hypothetical protein
MKKINWILTRFTTVTSFIRFHKFVKKILYGSYYFCTCWIIFSWLKVERFMTSLWNFLFQVASQAFTYLLLRINFLILSNQLLCPMCVLRCVRLELLLLFLKKVFIDRWTVLDGYFYCIWFLNFRFNFKEIMRCLFSTIFNRLNFLQMVLL